MTDWFLRLRADVDNLKRRLNTMARHGVVQQVNAAEGWVRLNLGEGDDNDLLSPKIPYTQFAGALKVHTPPSVGQTMTMFAPTGDPRQAVALPMTWSDQNESPSDSASENVLTFGEVRVELTEGGLRIEVGGFAMLISGAGLAMAGGAIGHNGQDIGASHQHPGVMPGPSRTGTPVDSAPTP